MKNFISITALFILLTYNVFTQNLRQKAEENPLDCALYLLSKDQDAVETNFLPQEFIKIGRYDDAIKIIERNDNSYSQFETLVAISKDLLDSNKLEKANVFLTKAFTILRDDEKWSHESSLYKFASSLVRANRAAEAAEALEILAHQEDDKDRAEIHLALAETYFKTSQNEAAEKSLDEAFSLRASFVTKYDTGRLITLLIQYSSPKKAAEYLAQFEKDIFQIENEEEKSREIINFLPHLYFKNGQKEKAFETLNEYGDKDDSTESLNLVLTLLKNNDKENAVSLFKKIRLNEDKSDNYGRMLVEVYLKFNDVKAAIKTANEMSVDVDDYDQQSAFMMISDKLIADKKINEALNLLDFAYLRAAKVGEIHLTQDSIGASSLTRKIIYLRNIKQRYFKLNRFDHGLSVINALKIRDSHYQKFYSDSLIHYVNEQSKTLPRKKIDELLTKAENIFDEDEDYYRMQARVSIAKIYAQIGEKQKAVELLTKVLEEAKESCCYDDDFLISAGKVFDEQKLTADENMKNILRQYIEEVEN